MGKRGLALPLRRTASVCGHFSGITAKWLYEMTLFPLFSSSPCFSCFPLIPSMLLTLCIFNFLTSPISFCRLSLLAFVQLTLSQWISADVIHNFKFYHEIGERRVCMTERGRGKDRDWAKDYLISFHSALSLLIAPPDIIHLLQEFVLRSRTNTLANPLSWRSDTEQDTHTHTCVHAHSVPVFLRFFKNLLLFYEAIYTTQQNSMPTHS